MENTVFTTIIRLRWDKKYEEALKQYSSLVHGKYPLSGLIQNPDLLNAVIDSLKLTARIKEAILMIEDVWKLVESESMPEMLLVNVCWTYNMVFDLNKKYVLPANPYRCAFIAKLLNKIVRSNPHLHTMLLFRYLEWLEISSDNNYSEMQALLDSVDPGLLSPREEHVTTKKDGIEKTFALASSLEKWYAWQTKTLYKLANYRRCIEICHEALSKIGAFHHGNHVWVARRMALAYRQSGDLTRATHELERLASIKKDWFIQKELAELYFQQQNIDNALSLCCEAVINQGYTEYKAGLFQLAGEIMLEANRVTDARLLLWIAANTRDEHKWKRPERLATLLQTIEPAPTGTARQLYNKLLNSWKTAAPAIDYTGAINNQKLLHSHGNITRVLHPGTQGDGFITSHEGLSIYFRVDACNFPLDVNAERSLVSFIAKQRTHNGKTVWNAVKVYLARVEDS